MSESSVAKKSTRINRGVLAILIFVGIFVLLGIGYFGGALALPQMIDSRYQDKNCASVLSLDGIYKKIYPAIMLEGSTRELAKECAVYTLATNNAEKQAWQDSYNAFYVYSEAYPDGLFINEAHDRTALVLSGLARENLAQKKYPEALSSIDQVLERYGDTAVAADVQNLIPEVYFSWGADLRTAGDFPGAEQIFNTYKAWAQSNQKTEFGTSAQQELARTYLLWGLSLQSEKHFDEAKTKLDLAISSDPTSQANDGPAAQAKANQPKLYIGWGDYFIEQKDYSGAMEYYNTALNLSVAGEQAAVRDAITNGYIKWAEGLGASEDFLGALILLDFAQESTATDSTRTLVEDSRSELYLAFSQSDGEQAHNAMLNAVRIVCGHQAPPRLPIFGLSSETVRAEIYGTDEKLPENVAATTPGSLHYAVCIEEDFKTVESTIHRIAVSVFNPSARGASIDVRYERIQYEWNVTLRKMDTGTKVATAQILGGAPPPFPADAAGIVKGAKNPHYFGSKPDVAELAAWLLSVIQ